MNKSTKQTLEKKMNVIKSILNDEIDAVTLDNFYNTLLNKNSIALKDEHSKCIKLLEF